MSNSCLIDPTTLVTTPKRNGGVPVANVKSPCLNAKGKGHPNTITFQDSLFSPQPDILSSAGFGNALFQPAPTQRDASESQFFSKQNCKSKCCAPCWTKWWAWHAHGRISKCRMISGLTSFTMSSFGTKMKMDRLARRKQTQYAVLY